MIAVDPCYDDDDFLDRTVENLESAMVSQCVELRAQSAADFFENYGPFKVSGVCIDGDHSAPEPLNDAKGAASHLKPRGVIVLHDVLGGPVQEAVVWLLDNGFRARIYWTPHVMAVCWRGDFTPPDHVPDPQIEPKLRPQMAGFPFERCE